MMNMNLASFTPFAMSLSKGFLFLSEEKGTCFDKLSTNGPRKIEFT